MDPLPRHLEVRCLQCGGTVVCGPEEMDQRLRALGMLRREQTPEREILIELFSTAADRMSCSACGQTGLAVGPAAEETDDDWPGRGCEACGAAIPAERLEVFPDARLCANCQARDERGESLEEPEYCPKCGGLMQIRQAGGRGITRYVMACGDCRR